MKIFDLIMSVTQCNIMHYCSKVSLNFTHDFSVHENCFSTFREIWVKFKDFLLLYQIQEVKITQNRSQNQVTNTVTILGCRVKKKIILDFFPFKNISFILN